MRYITEIMQQTRRFSRNITYAGYFSEDATSKVTLLRNVCFFLHIE